MNRIVTDWYRQGKPITSKGVPHEVKAHVIETYGLQHDLNVFVETGTCHGAMVQAVADTFSEIYTVEMYPPSFEIARERLAVYPHVACYFGDSAEVLQAIVDALEGPALFFLDAHYSGGGTARGEDVDTPIVGELVILSRSPHRNVVIIDDARLFAGQDHHTDEFKDYPSLEWITEFVAENFLVPSRVEHVADEFIIEPIPS